MGFFGEHKPAFLALIMQKLSCCLVALETQADVLYIKACGELELQTEISCLALYNYTLLADFIRLFIENNKLSYPLLGVAVHDTLCIESVTHDSKKMSTDESNQWLKLVVNNGAKQSLYQVAISQVLITQLFCMAACIPIDLVTVTSTGIAQYALLKYVDTAYAWESGTMRIAEVIDHDARRLLANGLIPEKIVSYKNIDERFKLIALGLYYAGNSP